MVRPICTGNERHGARRRGMPIVLLTHITRMSYGKTLEREVTERVYLQHRPFTSAGGILRAFTVHTVSGKLTQQFTVDSWSSHTSAPKKVQDLELSCLFPLVDFCPPPLAIFPGEDLTSTEVSSAGLSWNLCTQLDLLL